MKRYMYKYLFKLYSLSNLHIIKSFNLKIFLKQIDFKEIKSYISNQKDSCIKFCLRNVGGLKFFPRRVQK